jgi:hypothetical protein
VLHGAGVLEIGVTGGVSPMRRDLFAGCHFCAFLVLNHWFSRGVGRGLVHGPGKSLVLFERNLKIIAIAPGGVASLLILQHGGIG